MDDAIGKNIKDARIKRGLLQADLAEKIGVNQKDISNWERGVKIPGSENLKKICIALQVSADDILGIRLESGK